MESEQVHLWIFLFLLPNNIHIHFLNFRILKLTIPKLMSFMITNQPLKKAPGYEKVRPEFVLLLEIQIGKKCMPQINSTISCWILAITLGILKTTFKRYFLFLYSKFKRTTTLGKLFLRTRTNRNPTWRSWIWHFVHIWNERSK